MGSRHRDLPRVCAMRTKKAAPTKDSQRNHDEARVANGSTVVNTFLSKLERVKPTRNGWKARCPVHNDKRPSLDLSLGEKGLLLNCKAGCSTKAIVATLGLKMADLFFNGHAKL